MSQIENIDVYKLAEQRYGVDNVSEFPGQQLTNINRFSDFCFETAAEFVDQDKEIQNTTEGQKCESAVIQQMLLSGKEKPVNRFRLPIILSKPQYFKDAYLKTGNIEEAYRIAVNSCISNGNPGLEQSTCIERATNARDAMILSQSGISDLNKVEDIVEDIAEDIAEDVDKEKYSTSSENNRCGNIILTIVLVVGLLCLITLMINRVKTNKSV